MSRRTLLLLALFSMFGPVRPGFAQAPIAQITWEVTNRFRLFAEQKDFDRHVSAWRSDNSGTSKSILETEQALEKQLGGGGWASTVGRVCYDRMTGELPQSCMRDNKREDYFKPDSHLG